MIGRCRAASTWTPIAFIADIHSPRCPARSRTPPTIATREVIRASPIVIIPRSGAEERPSVISRAPMRVGAAVRRSALPRMAAAPSAEEHDRDAALRRGRACRAARGASRRTRRAPRRWRRTSSVTAIAAVRLESWLVSGCCGCHPDFLYRFSKEHLLYASWLAHRKVGQLRQKRTCTSVPVTLHTLQHVYRAGGARARAFQRARTPAATEVG